MTTLTLLLAQALRREMQAGDEVVITELDHEANRGPWLQLEEHGIVIRQVPSTRQPTPLIGRRSNGS